MRSYSKLWAKLEFYKMALSIYRYNDKRRQCMSHENCKTPDMAFVRVFQNFKKSDKTNFKISEIGVQKVSKIWNSGLSAGSHFRWYFNCFTNFDNFLRKSLISSAQVHVSWGRSIWWWKLIPFFDWTFTISSAIIADFFTLLRFTRRPLEKLFKKHNNPIQVTSRFRKILKISN